MVRRILLRLLLLLLLLAVPAMAQIPVIPVGGIATIDISQCPNITGGTTCTFKVILTANTTVSLINSRGNVDIFFLENAVGGWTVSWPATVTSPPTVTPTASTTTLVSLKFDSGTGLWYVTGGGGSTSANPPSPIMGFYLTGNCLPANLGQCFNSPADTIQVNDCGWTNAATDVICTGSHFTAADVGKSAMGWQLCVDDSTFGAGAIATTTAVTIASFVSPTHITLSAIPANTATIAGGSPHGACFIYGHLDDAGATAVDAAMALSTSCPRLFLAAANYFFSNPHFYNNPPACAGIGPGLSNTFGTTTLPAGFEVEGRGVGPTSIYLNTNFPNGDACTHKPTPSAATGGCFSIPVMGKWSDFRIDGGSQGTTPNLNGKTLISAAVGTIMNFTCLNEGGGNSTMTGIQLDFLVQLYQVNNAGCGGIAFNTAPNTYSSGIRVISENSSNSALIVGSGSASEFTCYWCQFALGGGGGVPTITNAGTLRLFGGYVLAANFPGGANAGVTGIQGSGTTARLYADSTKIDVTQTTATNNGAVTCGGAGCVVSLVNTSLKGQSAGFSYADGAGGTLFIDGATTYTQPFSNQTIVGSIAADGHSLRGACTGVAAASQTIGFYGTGPNVTSTLCTNLTIGTGIVMTRAGTLANLTVTSSAGGVNASSGVVTVLKNGAGTTLTCTMGTGTACSDFTHTAAFVAGDLISLQFTTQAAETLANVKAFVMW